MTTLQEALKKAMAGGAAPTPSIDKFTSIGNAKATAAVAKGGPTRLLHVDTTRIMQSLSAQQPVLPTPDGPTQVHTPLAKPSASAAPPASPSATVGIVVPSEYTSVEGYGTDYDPWTYQTFRIVLRYGPEMVPVDRHIREIAFRPDSTWNYQLVDRLGGPCRIWVSQWDGTHGFGWPAKGTLLYDEHYDPPAYSIPQAWVPQPFTVRFTLSAPFVVPVGQGFQIEIQLDGVPDPVWGNRATYWVDVAGDGGGSVVDMWLDDQEPYMGCAGFPSETRTWMVPNRLSLWAQQAALPNAPAVVIISPAPVLDPGCLDVDLTGATLITTQSDAAGQVMVTVPFPLTPVEFAWQTLIYDAAKSDPLQMLGSGHFVRFNPSGIPCGILWDKNPNSGAPYYTLPGTVFVTEIR